MFLSTNEKTRVPEPTPRRLEYGCERLNRYRHGWWSRPLACPHTEWPASWHRNLCLVIHPDRVCSWTGKRIGRFESTSGTKKPHFATFQNHSTSTNPASLFNSHTKKQPSCLFWGGIVLSKKKERGVAKHDVRPPPLKVARLFIVPSQLTKKKYHGRNVVLQRCEPATLGNPLRARHERGKTVKVFSVCAS